MLLLVLLCCIGISAVPLHDQITPREGEACGYESCTQAKPGVLNVHIVPHTHDDVGWLKTVDQYYYGSRNNIQKAGVQYIIDSVIKELWQDPKRRFMYVETAFFWKWWVKQTDDTRHKVHTLVRQGRLQFVGGAWSMNDEAASHYHSVLDQFTWGLSKLNDTFGSCGLPRVGWQIDPFGHSREFASLLATMGYDGLFLGRIDYQDKQARLRGRNMEMVWRGDDDLGAPSDIFTGVLYNTYSPPPGFCFDVLCDDEPIIDDVSSPMYNVDQRIQLFLDYVKDQSNSYKTNNVIITMGGDFTYQDATMWYTNLDKLIQHANLKSAKEGLNITLFYSTPDCYLKAVKDANPTLPTKQDDFFPYANDPTAYWTGYFTSRPTTKYFEREGNTYLQMVKQLQVVADLQKHNKFVIDELKSAMGVFQHHDAITGTEKQHVTHDYERLLNDAIEDSLIVARQAFSKKSRSSLYSFDRCRFNESSCATSEDSGQFVVTVYNALGWSVKTPIRIPAVDASYVVYGPDGKEIESDIIDIPNAVLKIPTRTSKATHEVIFIDTIPPIGFKSYYIKKQEKTRRDIHDKEFYNINNYWDNLKVKPIIEIENIVPEVTEKIPDRPTEAVESNINTVKDINIDVLKDAEGVSDDVIELQKIIREAKSGRRDKKYPKLNDEEMRMLGDDPMVVERPDDVIVENMFTLRLNDSNGWFLDTFQHGDNVTGPIYMVNIQPMYYQGFYGDNKNPSTRSSGAYIFRPMASEPKPLKLINEEQRKTKIHVEHRIEASQNYYFSTRIYKGLKYVEVDWVVGPIGIEDKIGKEFIIKYNTNITSNGEFYTDSNGRQMIKRKLDERPQWNVSIAEPVAGNYYPVTSRIQIKDDDNTFSVLTDRSEGGASLEEGGIELMLHRRLLHDDAFGVGEALNETAKGIGLVARGQHNVIFDDVDVKRDFELLMQPKIFVSKADDYDEWLKLNNEFSGIKTDLVKGLHLLTVETWKESKMLLRLENYLTNDDTDNVLSVDLNNIFNNINVKAFRETTLSANRWLDEHKQWVWKKENEFVKSFNKQYFSFDEVDYANDDEDDDYNDEGFLIKIKPKQIRTFVVEYDVVNDS